MGRHEGGLFGIKRGGDRNRRREVRPIAFAQRPHGACDHAASCLGAGLMRLHQCAQVERVVVVVKAHAHQPVMQDVIGVGRGDGGPGGEIIGVDGFYQTGMVDHHTGGPKGRWLIARARHQFLPHAAIQKGYQRHLLLLHHTQRQKGKDPGCQFVHHTHAGGEGLSGISGQGAVA